METEKTPKTPKEIICEKCDFKCFKPSDYKRHLGTAKHKILTNTDKKGEKNVGMHMW